VASKNAAVLAHTSTWSIIPLLAVESILTTKSLELALAVLLGLFRGVGAIGGLCVSKAIRNGSGCTHLERLALWPVAALLRSSAVMSDIVID